MDNILVVIWFMFYFITCVNIYTSKFNADSSIYVAHSLTHQGKVDHRIIVDPTSLEERFGDGNMMVSFMPSLLQITQVVQSGNMRKGESEEVCSPPNYPPFMNVCVSIFKH